VSELFCALCIIHAAFGYIPNDLTIFFPNDFCKQPSMANLSEGWIQVQSPAFRKRQILEQNARLLETS